MISALAAALLHFVWQGALIAFLLWIALTLLRRSSPDARYCACAAALALMTAAPVISIVALYRPPAQLRAAGILFALAASNTTFAPSHPDLRQWIVPLWAVGVAIFAMRLAFAWRHVARLRRGAAPVEPALTGRAISLARQVGVTRPVRILVSALAEAPSVVGWLKPAILLPVAALVGLDAAQLESILVHEFAHIRRHDYLVNLLQTVSETLLFYHPAVWWVSSRMRHERELCCDDFAVRYCGDPLLYARALTRMERLRTEPTPAVAANGGSLLYRIQRLTGAIHESAPSRLPLILALLVLALPLARHRAAATQQLPTPATAVQPPPITSRQSASVPVPTLSDSGTRGTVVVTATLSSTGAVLDASVVSGPLSLRAQALRFVLGRKVAAPKRAEDTLYISLVLNAKGVVEMKTFPQEEFSLERAGQLLTEEQETLKQLSLRMQQVEEQRKTVAAAGAQLDRNASNLSQMDQLAYLEAQLKGVRQTYGPDAPQVKSLKTQIAAAQNQLNEARQNSQDRRDLLQAQLGGLRQRLAYVQQSDGASRSYIEELKLQIAQTELLVAESNRNVAESMRGAKVYSIDRGPLEFDVALPIHVGDTVSAVSIEQLTEAVHKADPSLDVRLVREGDNQISIQIVRRR